MDKHHESNKGVGTVSGKHPHESSKPKKHEPGKDVDNGTKRTGDSINSDREIKTLEQAHQWGSKYYDNWLESLTQGERNAIIQYTGNDYTKINRYLRGLSDSLDGVDLQVVDNIISGLNKAKVPHNITVYRGTDFKPFQKIIKYDKYGNIKAESLVGKKIKDNGFVSTAIVKESSFDHMPISWDIHVPQGSKAAYVGKISHYPNEAELLLNAGQEMVIKSAKVDSGGKLQIVVELI
ncbi:ADP-ribosyltransferase [Bacillus sp. CLL-7-23]|uniref:ADP-ribosyltransferase n=1 Tax=Bacillus changyiensis TaxID=3004103 RepID=A0ABT4X8J2_9BACI|nr:ADP-ribosyltransferase [Bacillus changyiensis]MDA7028616.1 ADP-ribosyltransferase [Bacillus changyiensis]